MSKELRTLFIGYGIFTSTTLLVVFIWILINSLFLKIVLTVLLLISSILAFVKVLKKLKNE